MATQFAPRLAASEYARMRDLMYAGDLPSSFSEWQRKESRQTDSCRAMGHEIAYVDVTAEEFLSACFDRGWPTNVVSLDRYVWHKGRSRKPG